MTSRRYKKKNVKCYKEVIYFKKSLPGENNKNGVFCNNPRVMTVPQPNLTLFQKSFSFDTPRIFNNLPEKITILIIGQHLLNWLKNG